MSDPIADRVEAFLPDILAAPAEAVTTSRALGGSIVSMGVPRSNASESVPLPEAALANPVIQALVEPAAAELLAAERWRRAAASTIRQSGTT